MCRDAARGFGRFLLYLAVPALLLSAGCGGGSQTGGGTGGTGISTAGTLTTGSAIVNGVRYDDSATAVTADGTPKTPAFLDNGMRVKLKGRINADRITGAADLIEVENEVRGAIAAKNADTMTVLGQTILVHGGTFFANVANFAALAPNDNVEVHGQRNAAGTIVATRVELLGPAQAEDEIRGTVGNKTGTTFTIGTQVIGWDNATQIVGGPAFDNGDLVEVRLDGTGRAAVVELEDVEDAGFDVAEGEEKEVEGFVTGFDGTIPDDIFVNGVPVRMTGSTRFEGGTPGEFANDALVEAEGHMVGGFLVADRIEFDDSIRIEANADGPGSAGALGRNVFVMSATVFVNLPGGVADILAGDGLKVRGFINIDNSSITATRVEKLAGPVPDSLHVIQGIVGAFDAGAGTMSIAGVAVNAAGASQILGDDDVSLTLSQFFGLLTANRSVVKATGTFAGGTITASSVEIE